MHTIVNCALQDAYYTFEKVRITGVKLSKPKAAGQGRGREGQTFKKKYQSENPYIQKKVVFLQLEILEKAKNITLIN